MRHRYNKLLELDTGVQKKKNVLRNIITSLLEYKKVITTPKRWKVLKHEVEKLFAKLVRTYNRYDDKDVSIREVKRVLSSVVFDKNIIENIIDEKLMWYLEEKRVSWFVRNYRVGFTKWDTVEKIMIELV